MALNSADMRVGISGAIVFAPVGIRAPADSVAALPEAWRDVGYLSEDGVEEERSRSLNETTAWQNSDVVRVSVTSASFTLALTMIETNRNSLEFFYGAPVQPDGSIIIEPGETGPRRAMVFDYIYGPSYCRLYLPQAQVAEVDTVTVNSTDPVGYTAIEAPVQTPARADELGFFLSREGCSGLLTAVLALSLCPRPSGHRSSWATRNRPGRNLSTDPIRAR